jgi:hypothetical protein
MSLPREISKCLIAGAAFLSSSAGAAPVISIGSMFDYLAPEKSTLLKQIRNTGESTAFVKVSISEIIYREGGDSEERPVDLKSLGTGGVGLMASPMRLIVPAGGVQATRLLFRGERDVERHYHVRFIPVLPDLGDGFALPDAQREQYKDELQAGVNVLTGYGAITIVRPRAVHFDTRIDKATDQVVVRNQGNSTIVLDALVLCDESQQHCDSPVVRHVRPGADLPLHRRAGQIVQFTLVEGDKRKPINIE